MKKIVVLGSTGSVGKQTLEVVTAHPEEFKIVGLGCRSEIGLLKEQIDRFSPEFVGVIDEEKGKILAVQLRRRKTKVFVGSKAMCHLATVKGAEMVVVAVMGAAGILPTLQAIKAKKDIALATKEVMVSAGDLINEEVAKNGVRLIPVDSEHSAIFQCLHGGQKKEINKIYLTCSGGAFQGKKRQELKEVGPAEALKHPNWKMGAKITVDCATLMNKGLELIEAQKLFGLNLDQIQIVIHPQSIIHSMIEFVDGSILAEMGPADMRFPIRYALAYPKRLENHFQFLNLYAVNQLTFIEPDWETFECLGLALQASQIGGTMPTVLNAADEVAVSLFLKGEIKFLEIPEIIRTVMFDHQIIKNPTLEEIFRVDNWARRQAGGKTVVS